MPPTPSSINSELADLEREALELHHQKPTHAPDEQLKQSDDPTKARDLEMPKGSDVPLTRIEEALQDEMNSEDPGSFCLRGTTLGNKWAKQQSQDPELKARYRACTDGLTSRTEREEAQKAFRRIWISDMWADAMQERREAHTTIDKNSQDGGFHTLEWWINEEGGGRPTTAAVEGVRTFVANVMSMPVAERSRYMMVHELTGRLEIAIPKKKWQIGERSTKTIESTSSAVSSHGKAKAKSASTPSKRPKAASTSDGVDKIEKKAKKELTESAMHWKEIQQTHTIVNVAMTMAGTVQRTSKKDEGAYLGKTQDFATMQQGVQKVESLLNETTFWHNMNLMTFSKFKKSCTEEQVLMAYESTKSLKVIAEEVTQNARLVSGQHEARKSILGLK